MATHKAPTRTCDNPNCDESYHPLCKVCPNCGTKNSKAPSNKKKRKRRRPTPQFATDNGEITLRARVVVSNADALDAAIAFVEKCGGLRKAQLQLSRIEKIKSL